MTSLKDCKRWLELMDQAIEREVGHCASIMPLPNNFSLLDGYAEHEDVDIAIFSYHIAGDSSAHSVACKLSDGSKI